GHGGHTRPDHRTSARGLADRTIQLALGIFYQPAVWSTRRRRNSDLHLRDPARSARGIRLLWFRELEPGDRRVANDARPRRAEGLVRFERDLGRSNDRGARPLLVRRPYRDSHRPLLPQSRPAERRQLRNRHIAHVPHRHSALWDDDPVADNAAGSDELSG